MKGLLRGLAVLAMVTLMLSPRNAYAAEYVQAESLVLGQRQFSEAGDVYMVNVLELAALLNSFEESDERTEALNGQIMEYALFLEAFSQWSGSIYDDIIEFEASIDSQRQAENEEDVQYTLEPNRWTYRFAGTPRTVVSVREDRLYLITYEGVDNLAYLELVKTKSGYFEQYIEQHISDSDGTQTTVVLRSYTTEKKRSLAYEQRTGDFQFETLPKIYSMAPRSETDFFKGMKNLLTYTKGGPIRIDGKRIVLDTSLPL